MARTVNKTEMPLATSYEVMVFWSKGLIILLKFLWDTRRLPMAHTLEIAVLKETGKIYGSSDIWLTTVETGC